MYLVCYLKNGVSKCEVHETWTSAFAVYNRLNPLVNIVDLYIKDCEYDVKFARGRWEPREELIGWCGRR